jgi:hypothetical protein
MFRKSIQLYECPGRLKLLPRHFYKELESEEISRFLSFAILGISSFLKMRSTIIQITEEFRPVSRGHVIGIPAFLANDFSNSKFKI